MSGSQLPTGRDGLAFASMLSADAAARFSPVRPDTAATTAVDESHALITALFATVDDIVCVCDPDLHVRFVNAAVESVCGWTPESFLGRWRLRFAEPIDETAMRHAIDVATQNGAARTEFRSFRKNGKILYLAVNVIDARETPGVGALVITLRDITIQRLSELELSRRQTIEELGARIAERFLDAAELDANRAYALEELTRFTEADACLLVMLDEDAGTEFTLAQWHAPIADIVAWQPLGLPRDIDPASLSLSQLRQPTLIHTLEEFGDIPTFISDPAVSAPVEAMLSVPIFRSNRLVGSIALVSMTERYEWAADLIDLLRRAGQVFLGADERRQVDDALRGSEARFRALVENASDMVMVINDHLEPTFVSPAVSRIMGWDSRALVGDSRKDVMHPDDVDAFRNGVEDAIRTGQGGASYRMLTASGTWMHVESTITNALSEPSVGGLILNSRDVTERRSAEEVLERRRIAEQVTLSVSRLFLDTPADELNTAIGDSLATVAQHIDADGATITTVVPGTETTHVEHRWIAPHTTEADLLIANTHVEVSLLLTGKIFGTLRYEFCDATRQLTDEASGLVRSLAELTATAYERRRAQAALQASEARFRALVHFGSDMVFVVNTGGFVTFASPAISNVLGWALEAVEGRSLIDLVYPDDQLVMQQTLRTVENERNSNELEFRVQSANGNWIWVAASVTNLLDTPGVAGLVVEARDIAERKAIEADLEREARTDGLTMLPNRTALHEALIAAFDDPETHGQHLAVMFMDLDGFKAVNDTYGHGAGDTVLIEVASRLRKLMRPGDIVARLGGDEFVIVCEDADNEPVCRAISARVFRALSRPIALDNGETANIGTSIGIAIATEVSFDPNELLRQADAAMYEAKRAGKRRMVFAHSMTFNESDTSAALSATLERHVDPLLEEAANANVVRTSDGDRSVGEDYVPDEIANEATE